MSTDVVPSENFLPTAAAGFADAWREEMGDELPEFPRVKIPAGGGSAWEIPSGDPDNPDIAKELVGVIVAHHATSRLYLESFEDRTSDSTGRPDAWSIDGKVQVVPAETLEKVKELGLPAPLTDLAACPYNQFGSAHLLGGSGNGKASRNYHEVYLYLGNGAVFPVQVSIPATSIKAFKTYLSQSVLGRGLVPSQVLTKLSLKKVQSGGGIDYSTVVFANVGPLDEAVAAEIKKFSGDIKAIVSRDPFAALPTSTDQVYATAGAGATFEATTVPADDDIDF